MKKSVNRIMAMALASVIMVSGVNFIYMPLVSKATEVIANPTMQELSITGCAGGLKTHIEKEIPMYSIIQENGWSSNYVKLRDIAYFMDFDVQWSADEPNVMHIYTNRHYLEPLESTGPATETKNAVVSTMEMYVDNIKVDTQSYMIENNNYFKIRDIAKTLNFGCWFGSDNKVSYVSLSAKHFYDESGGVVPGRDISYESPVWYDSSSGTLFDTPIVQKASQPWARMNYYEKYASPKLKAEDHDWEYVSRFNAAVQALIDQETILSNTDGALGVRDYFVQHPKENCGNPYYQYPIGIGSFHFSTDVASLNLSGYGLNLNNTLYTITQPASPADRSDKEIQITKQAAADIIAKAKTFDTDREALTYLGKEVCKRITYYGYNGSEKLPGAINMIYDGTIWAPDAHANGICMEYARAFEYLSAAAGYTYVRVSSADHQWDEVFLPDEGKWVIMDCTYADGYDMYNTDEGKYEKYLCCELEDYDEQYSLGGSGLLVKDLVTAAYKAKLAGE